MDFFDYVKNNRIIISIFAIILCVLLVIFVFFFKNDTDAFDEVNDSQVVALNLYQKEENNKEFYVEIKGQVKKPSVYKVNEDNIIYDLVNMAGGFTKNAYTNNINLSKKLTEELVVYVFSKNEYKKLNKPTVITETKTIKIVEPCETKTYEINNCTDNLQSEIIASDVDTVFEKETKNVEIDNSKVNINTASKEILLTLSGVGESKAIAIINYRSENGPFKTIDDLLNVSGIGKSIFEKIKDSITV